MDNKRIIESEKLQVKLLNGSVISIRALTLAERKECLALLPKDLDTGKPANFAEQWMNFQENVVHYIITRSNKDFKKEDVSNLLDSSLVEQIVKFTLKDPFSAMIGW